MKKFRLLFKEGKPVGDVGLILVKELPYRLRNDGRRRRMGIFKCSCGKEFESGIIGVKHGHAKSCGCLQKATAAIVMQETMTIHGYSKYPLFSTWLSMKDRILNSENPEYKNYGGRGIGIFPPWQVDFQLFCDYVSALPNFERKKYSIDRVNNNGNYEPGNIRWTTRHIQNTNKRKREDNTSGYVGVSIFRNKWQSFIGGKHLGHFETKEQGVIARNNYIISNNLTEYKIQEVG